MNNVWTMNTATNFVRRRTERVRGEAESPESMDERKCNAYHRAMPRIVKLGCVCWVLAAFLFGCSREKAAAPVLGEQSPQLKLPTDLTTKPGNTCEFKLTERVVRVEQPAFLKSIRSVSSDRRTLVFDSGDPIASNLHEGSILFVPGLVMRKVLATTQQDGHLVVVTKNPALLEAFKDANIHWATPVNFAELKSARSFSLRDILELRAYADTKLSLSGEDDGWAYTVTATPGPDRLNVALTVAKQYNGLDVKINGSGYVQNFQNAVSIAIKDGKLDTLDYQDSGLSGAVDFNWEASKNSGGVEAEEHGVKLPSSFTIPLPIGGIPFSLEVSEALLIHPAFTGGSEAVRGNFHVDFNGSQGFKFDSGKVDPEGEAGGDGSIVNHASVSAVAPVGFVAAICMPRIELKLGTDSLFDTLASLAPPTLADGLVNALKKTPFGNWFKENVGEKLKTTGAAYAQVVTSTSTIASGAGAFIPCQRAQLIITISVGANATVLGSEQGNVSKDIFRQEKKVMVPPIKACEG